MTEREAILHYLETDFNEPVRDPVWKHIYLSKAHERIISLKVFQDLHDIKQLGPAFLVYPGATHTRFAHSLGTFHLAKRIIANLVARSDRTVFSLAGVKAFLAAALLHDVGHFPFAHSLKNMQLVDHEALTGRLVMEDPLAATLQDELGVRPRQVAAIVDTSLPVGEGDEIQFFRKLLSGVLDPDKLDYLNRDAYFCGVPYGIQDVDFFLEEIRYDSEQGIALTAKGITAVENILFSKYLMYKTVYWHKTVRIATAMIKKCFMLALRDGVIVPDDLYLLTDRSLVSMIDTMTYQPFSLIADVFSRRLHKQVMSVPYDPSRAAHRALQDPHTCLEREKRVADEISALCGKPVPEEAVLIDLPEKLTFEIDLPILEASGRLPFRRTRHVFQTASSAGIAESLRVVSLFIRRDGDFLPAAEKFVAGADPFS